jgi:hypothetical protein
MSDNDVWIEVNKTNTHLAQFYSTFAESRPMYGTSGPFSGTGIPQVVCKFNLTAYVKHMIAEALNGSKTPSE